MGQFTHFSSYAPWRIKTAWVKALFQRAVKICSTESTNKEDIIIYVVEWIPLWIFMQIK